MKPLCIILHLAIVATSVIAIIVPPEAPGTSADRKAKVDKFKHNTVGFYITSSCYPVDDTHSQLDTLVAYPPLSHQSEVNKISADLSLPNIQSWVNELTNYHNRYLVTDGGARSAEWFVQTVSDIISNYPGSGATVRPFVHSWAQNSVIARIPGSTDGPITIISAHLDSINRKDLHEGRAPGADDNAAAASDILEVFRVLVASKSFKPRTAVEFHWYSGEEPGSLGSQPIAKSYKDAGIQVKAMMNLVLTAYIPPGTQEVIALMPDYVHQGLNAFLVKIIEQYSTLPHISRLEIANPYRHSENDTIHVPGFSWSHTFEFAKISLAFAYELSV
ncbi:putative leucine aminopeptidase [Termitomyces sp. J132]|nr:putative leucine aminopeptidase [Termitomyces sp. J132]